MGISIIAKNRDSALHHGTLKDYYNTIHTALSINRSQVVSEFTNCEVLFFSEELKQVENGKEHEFICTNSSRV